MKKVFLNKKLIDDFETDERYYEDIAREVGALSSEQEEDVQVIFLNDEYGSADGNPVPIDLIIDQLVEMKKNGASHVSLDFHCDHETFEISSYKIEPATPSEIEEHLKTVDASKKLAKTLEIQRLEEKLKQLKNE